MDDFDTKSDLDKKLDRAVNAGKAIIVIILIGAIGLAGLVVYVALHFLTKWW